VLVKRNQGLKLWRQHTAQERVQPLVDHMARLKRQRDHQ
jgi:hypothetical protein